MKILANENFPSDAVTALREAGHDVKWVRTDMPGIGDPEVIATAIREDRLLLTLDKDFGELIYRSNLESPVGIILFRITPSSPLRVAKTAVAVLGSRSDWEGYFTVVEENRIRMTPLPKRK